MLGYSMQGRSQRGVQGVQLNPPSKLMIFMTIVMPFRGEEATLGWGGEN